MKNITVDLSSTTDSFYNALPFPPQQDQTPKLQLSRCKRYYIYNEEEKVEFIAWYTETEYCQSTIGPKATNTHPAWDSTRRTSIIWENFV